MRFLKTEGSPSFRLGAIVCANLTFILACAFNALAASGAGTAIGLTKNTTGNISALYETPITPAGWTFGIWGIIYTQQAAWLLYGIVSIFRISQAGKLYCSPNVLPPSIYILFIINLIGNVAWLILWDGEQMIAALVMCFFMSNPLYMAISVACSTMQSYKEQLYVVGLKRDILWLRLLVQNGLATYGTWLVVATLINLVIVLHYSAGLAADKATYIAQCLLLVILVIYHCVTNFVLNMYTRYLISPYFVLIWALAGIVDKHPVTDGNGIFSVCLLAAVIGLCINKFALDCYRYAQENPLSMPIVFEKFAHKVSIGGKDMPESLSTEALDNL